MLSDVAMLKARGTKHLLNIHAPPSINAIKATNAIKAKSTFLVHGNRDVEEFSITKLSVSWKTAIDVYVGEIILRAKLSDSAIEPCVRIKAEYSPGLAYV